MRKTQPRSEVALVLSGGASLGALQVGVLRALVNDGFRPSMVVGTSVGALNAAYLAFHPEPEDIATLESIWLGIKTGDIFPRNPVRMGYHLLTGRTHLFGTTYVEGLIDDFLPVDDFRSARIPLHLTATNLTRGEKVVFSQGRVSEALLASIAIPGLFPPRLRRKDLLVDGGLVANLDIRTAVDHGARRVLAIDVAGCQAMPVRHDLQGILLRSQHLMVRKQTEDEVEHCRRVAEVILVCPKLGKPVDPTDFSHSAELIEAGAAIADGLRASVAQEPPQVAAMSA